MYNIASCELCTIRKGDLTFLFVSFMVDFHSIEVVKIFLVSITQMTVGSYQLRDTLISQTITEFGVDKPEG